jgi:nitrogen fixation protein FixH
MKKTLSLAFIAALAVTVVAGCTKGYETRKTAGDLTITLSASSYPLVKGDNTLTVKLADSSGKPVTDAKVDVRYYMPAMPGMAPMEYTAQATPAGDAYRFTANIPMEGGWRVDVTTNRGGSVLPAVTFNIDVR